MQFKIEFKTDHLDRVMEAVRREIATSKEMLGSIGESLLRVNRERHDRGLAPDGSKWKELSPLTLGNAVWKKQDESFRKSKSMSIKTAQKVRASRGGAEGYGQYAAKFSLSGIE
jgi:hypothetical protein